VDVRPGEGDLAVARIGPRSARDLGRRSVALRWERLVVPTLVIDHSELVLRQSGLRGEEGFVLWAGTIAGDFALVSTLVVPEVSAAATHGYVAEETVAQALRLLDHHDLLPIAQLHSHPRRAFLSEIDATRPFVADLGFLSIVVPSFGFVDLADTSTWSAHEYLGGGAWRPLSIAEVGRRTVVDPSLLHVGR
jgi:hypothetical protein